MTNVAILPGDGIGPEIVHQAMRVLDAVNTSHKLGINSAEYLFGGAAYDVHGDPLPEATLIACRNADAILLGAVGGPKYDDAPRELRPERGLLRLRSELDLFANLRPATLFAELADASSLKPELVAGLNLMIVRELTSGLYFGQPRGIEDRNGVRTGFNTMVYSEPEIERIALRGFEIAMQRGKRLCSVDKMNVLEVSELWREVVERVGRDFPDVSLTHMYVDNAAMQLDAAAMLTGSIGMLPSASLDSNGKGMYEPVHGSAPDISGQGIANPLATISSVSMMLRYSLNQPQAADSIDAAVSSVLKNGLRCEDIANDTDTRNITVVNTAGMGDAVINALNST